MSRNSHSRDEGPGIIRYILGAIVIIALVAGIFTVARGLIRGGSGKKEKKGKEQTAQTAEATTAGADNSIQITDLKVEAPAPTIRVGQTMQLNITTEPADATNTKLKWSTTDGDLVTVSDDGVLTPEPGSEKHTVTVTAETTDGSGKKANFDLRIYPEIDVSKPMVAITFDDGPNADTTNPMLDVLEENYAKATFFCLGQNVEQYPETVQREYQLGMEVGTHTYSHQDLMSISDSERDKEIRMGVESIEKVIGVKPTLMRPPYGAYVSSSISGKADYDGRVRATAKQYGLTCVNWWVDTNDWKYKSADKTYEGVMVVQDGQIVLLHDIHAYNIDAVKRFVPDLIEKGYQLVTVTEMYEARQNDLGPDVIHCYTDPTTESSGDTEPAAADDGAQSEEPAAGSTDSTVQDTTATDSEGGMDFSTGN